MLLTAAVADHLVRIAFSCNNESRQIEPGKIDEFIGELDDVDIPPQHGIFMCVNRIAEGSDREEAVNRAEVAVQAFEALEPVDGNPDLIVATVQGISCMTF